MAASGTPPDLIGAAVAAWATEILAAVLAVLAVLFVWLFSEEQIVVRPVILVVVVLWDAGVD